MPQGAAVRRQGCGRRLRGSGYARAPDGRSPPLSLLLQYRRVDTLRRLAHRRRWALDRLAAAREPAPVAAALTSAQRALLP